jgi:phage terminase large subunit GpA-like protein
MMMISMDKKYRTRGGQEVRIYALDGGGSHTVQGACKHVETGVWVLSRWNEQGRISGPDFPGDLVEVKPRIQRTVWVNVYPKPTYAGANHLSKKIADQNAQSDRLACVKVEIDCEEGEGL